MHADIVELREFYASTLGHLAERSIGMALTPLWAKLPGERLVGLGYALPWTASRPTPSAPLPSCRPEWAR
jgi:hypothetical protein